MKRRGFIQLLGAAIAAPALPAMAPAATAAGYSRYTYGLAVFHARTRAHVSAKGLAYCLKVPAAQAEAMIAEMTSKGLVTPLMSGGSNVRAVSNILRPDAWGLDAATRKARAQTRRDRIEAQRKAVSDTLMGHLQNMARDYGFALSPRCVSV